VAKEMRDSGAKVSRIADDLQATVMSIRMMPVRQVFQRFPRLVRDIARTLDKNIELHVSGDETELDGMTLRSTCGDQSLRGAVCGRQSRLLIPGLKVLKREAQRGKALLGCAAEASRFAGAFRVRGLRRFLALNRHSAVVLDELEHGPYFIFGPVGVEVDLPAQIALLWVKRVGGEKIAGLAANFQISQVGKLKEQ
jgi:hypothetical protein